MHGRRGPHGGRHGRRQRGRAAHLLEPALLVVLQKGPAHGYALAEQVAALGLGGLPLRRVYRALQAMEELGWIVSTWDVERTQGPPRRVYALTGEGERVLEQWMTDLRESRDVIDRLLQRRE